MEVDINKIEEMSKGKEVRRMTSADFKLWNKFSSEYFSGDKKDEYLESFYRSVKPIVVKHLERRSDGLYYLDGLLVESFTNHGLRITQWDEEKYIYALIGFTTQDEKYKTEKIDLCRKDLQFVLKDFKLREIQNLEDVNNLLTYVILVLNEEIVPLLPKREVKPEPEKETNTEEILPVTAVQSQEDKVEEVAGVRIEKEEVSEKGDQGDHQE